MANAMRAAFGRAMLAAGQHVHQLTAIDYNKWQATGRSQVMAPEPLAAKWEAFGWHAQEIDGRSGSYRPGTRCRTSRKKSLVIVAHTIKGKGVSFMEDDNNWHYRTYIRELAAALAELKEVKLREMPLPA